MAKHDAGWDQLPAIGPIPASLHRECEQSPFEECGFCSEPLRDKPAYVVTKDLLHDRCVLELAICGPCQLECARTYSEKSREEILSFRNRFFECRTEGEPPEGSCDYCATPPEGFQRYSLLAVCRGASLLQHPEVICHRCEEWLQERLSPETRGVIDRYKDLYIPGVPEVGVDIPGVFFGAG